MEAPGESSNSHGQRGKVFQIRRQRNHIRRLQRPPKRKQRRSLIKKAATVELNYIILSKAKDLSANYKNIKKAQSL